MENWQKRLDIAINVAILCAFLMVAAVAAKRFVGRPSPGYTRQPQIGATVSLPRTDWSKSDQNLVLFLSTNCHFCSESADFYKRLIPAANSKEIPVLAVLPQSEREGRSYLELLGVPDTPVTQGSLASANVSGTPTILILDREGRLKKAWAGKLDSEGEQQVLTSLEPQSFHP